MLCTGKYIAVDESVLIKIMKEDAYRFYFEDLQGCVQIFRPKVMTVAQRVMLSTVVNYTPEDSILHMTRSTYGS